MMHRLRSIVRSILARTLFRPAGWLGSAVLFLAVFGVFHVLGWRDDTSFLTGTVPTKGADAMVVRGMLYSVAYLAAVLVSPILILAALLRVVLERMLRR